MGELVDRLGYAAKAALKAGDRRRVGVLRMLLAEIKTAETAAGGSKKSPEEAAAAYAKRLRKDAEEYRKLGRDERAEKVDWELAVVEEFLPQPLTRDELERIVDETIAEHGLSSPKQVGQAMKLIMQEYGDRAEGRVVQEIVRSRLSP